MLKKWVCCELVLVKPSLVFSFFNLKMYHPLKDVHIK